MAGKDDILLQNEHLIDLYLRGRLKNIEPEVFEQMLRTDETLRRQAIAMAELVKLMSLAGSREDEKQTTAIIEEDEWWNMANASPLEEVYVPPTDDERQPGMDIIPTDESSIDRDSVRYSSVNERTIYGDAKAPTSNNDQNGSVDSADTADPAGSADTADDETTDNPSPQDSDQKE